MKIPRRKFLKAGVLATAFASIPLKTGTSVGQSKKLKPPADYFPIPPDIQNDPFQYYTKATFAPYVGSTFAVRLSRSQVRYLQLRKVEDMCPASANTSVTTLGECFSLLFLGPRNAYLQQNTYKFEHAALGKFQLFIVPAGRHPTSKNQEYYKAIINRRQT